MATSVEEGHGNVVVTYEYKLAGVNEVIVPVRYELRSDGTIRLTATYPGTQGLPTMPCFGIEWALPATIDHLRFYGLGPVEAYADRLDGATLGVWETSAAKGIALVGAARTRLSRSDLPAPTQRADGRGRR